MISKNNNHGMFIYRISSNSLPESVIQRLKKVEYYKKHNITISCEHFNFESMIDSNIYIEHNQDFIYQDVKNAITFLSGGTIKSPKKIPYTLTDYNNSINATINALKLTDIVENRRVCLMHPFAPWAIGSIFQEALLRMNCHIFPIGFGLLPDRYNQQLIDFKPEILIGPASFLLKLIEKENRYIFDKCMAIINAGEQITPLMRKKFKDIDIDIETFNIYGMAEFDTIASECCKHKLHLLEEYFYFECLMNSNLNKQLEGELIITPLYRESFGVFRYRTEDLIELDDSSSCSCGYNGAIVQNIGRIGAISIDGVTLSEMELQEAIESTNLPIKEYQLHAVNAKSGYIHIYLDFTSDTKMNHDQIQRLYYAIQHINIDWEDLIRCKSCKIQIPQQIDSLDNRKTERGKLPKIIWSEDQ